MPRPSPIEIGRYLAREIAYRGFRGGSLYAWTRTAVRQGFKPPSAAKANAIGLLYGAMSALLGIPLLLSIPYIDPKAAFESGILLLAGLCAVFTLMQVTTFTATFVREGVIDLVRLLPIDYRTAFSSYLAALFLYWGALSLVAIFVPFLAMASVAAARGDIPPSMLLAGVFTSFSTLAFSTLLGLALGVASYAVRKRISLRVASTIGWLIAFSATYVVMSFHQAVIRYLAKHVSSVSQWLGLAPFIGPVYAYSDPSHLAISTALSLAILYATYRAAVSRLGAIFAGREFAEAPIPKPVARRAELPELRVSSPLVALVRKDLKLLGREPRRLASLLYLVVFPVIFSLAFTWGGGRGPYLVIPCFMGALSGLGSDNLYFVEGSGARVLYYLPVSRREVALSKALSTSVVTLPLACAASAIMVFMASGSISLALASLAIAATLNLGVSMLNSALNAKLLPREPSDWSELSVGSTLGRRFARSATKIALSLLSVAIPIALSMVGPLAGLSDAMAAGIIGAYGASMLVAGALSIHGLRGDLTS